MSPAGPRNRGGWGEVGVGGGGGGVWVFLVAGSQDGRGSWVSRAPGSS